MPTATPPGAKGFEAEEMLLREADGIERRANLYLSASPAARSPRERIALIDDLTTLLNRLALARAALRGRLQHNSRVSAASSAYARASRAAGRTGGRR